MIYNDEKIKAMALLKSFVNSEVLINNHFELIEEQQDIDIQAIEGIDLSIDINDSETAERNLQIEDKINDLIQAVKQLDRDTVKIKMGGKYE